MSLKTFVIVVGVLVALFVFGLAGQASGGLSSGTGVVDAVSGILGAPHLQAKDLRAANPACLDVANNTLVIPGGGTCAFDFGDSVNLDRRMVLRDGVTPGVEIRVKQEGLPTYKDTFPLPPGEEFRAFLERKRSNIFSKEPSPFTVSCVRVPPSPQSCRFPLR